MHLSTSTAAVVLAGLALGTLANLVSPRRIPWTEDWGHYINRAAATHGLHVVALPQVQALVAAGAHVIFDARAEASYRAGHLPGALSLPADRVEALFPQYAPVLEPGTPMLVYCSGEECDESIQLGTFLRDQGHTNISIFTGGYTAWQAAETNAPAPQK